MNSKTLLLLVLTAAVVTAPAMAQDRLDRLEVSLWPEFDRPAMLVMLRAWIPADSEFPVTVSLPMPLAAGTPSAVAYRSADGSMLIAPHQSTTEGDTIRVALTSPAPEIRLEYYVSLDIGNPVRTYRFEWPGGPAVGQLSYDVRQPWGAVDMKVLPAGSRKNLPDGRIEERGNLGALTATNAAAIEVVYTKPPATAGADTRPAAPSTQGASPSPRFTATEPTETDSRWIVLLVVSTVTFLCGFALGRLRRRS